MSADNNIEGFDMRREHDVNLEINADIADEIWEGTNSDNDHTTAHTEN